MIILRNLAQSLIDEKTKKVTFAFKPTFVILCKDPAEINIAPLRTNKQLDWYMENEQIILYDGYEGVHMYGGNEDVTVSLKGKELVFNADGKGLNTPIYVVAVRTVNVHKRKTEEK